MNWPILVIASSISAAIIVYLLWLSKPDNKAQKNLALTLAIFAFIIPLGLNYYFLGKPIDNTSDTSQYSKPLPDMESSIWAGGTTQIEPSKTKDMSMSGVTTRLEEKLKKNPTDIDGWILLGRSYAALGQSEKAIQLFQDKVDTYPNNINLLISYGETLTQLEGGIIPEEAKDLYLKAREINISHPRTEYNLALYDIQNGQKQLAYNRLKTLLSSASEKAPWVKQVREKIADMAKDSEIITD